MVNLQNGRTKDFVEMWNYSFENLNSFFHETKEIIVN